MTPFNFRSQLDQALRDSMSPAELRQAKCDVITKGFPNAVEKMGWRLLRSGEAFDPREHVIALVVGVALWSDPDILFLDRLAQKTHELPVYVFNMDDLVNVENLQNFLPCASPPSQTPVLGLYWAGRLIKIIEGKEAMDL